MEANESQPFFASSNQDGLHASKLLEVGESSSLLFDQVKQENEECEVAEVKAPSFPETEEKPERLLPDLAEQHLGEQQKARSATHVPGITVVIKTAAGERQRVVNVANFRGTFAQSTGGLSPGGSIPKSNRVKPCSSEIRIPDHRAETQNKMRQFTTIANRRFPPSSSVNLKCPICSQVLHGTPAFAEHMKFYYETSSAETGTSAFRYRCKLCQLRFPKEDTIIVHLQAHSSREEPSYTFKQCGLCFEKFPTEAGLNYHCQTSHGIFTTGMIHSRRNRPSLAVNRSQKVAANPPTVPNSAHTKAVAKSNSPTSSALEYVKDRQELKLKHYCIFCRKSFAARQALINHRHLFHLNTTLNHRIIVREDYKEVPKKAMPTCNACGKKFWDQKSVEGHQKSLKAGKFQCNICKKKFCLLHLLKAHRTQNHHVVCKHCRQEFKDEEALESHQKILKDSKFQCKSCEEKFCCLSLLKLHRSRHHPEAAKQEDKPFKCKHCGKGFCHKGVLGQHENTHLDNCRYRCESCSKPFPNRQCLEQHWNTHIELCHHLCEVCGKYWSTPEQLKKHQEIHDEAHQKRYKCEICKATFGFHSNFRRHLKLVHMGVKDTSSKQTKSKQRKVLARKLSAAAAIKLS